MRFSSFAEEQTYLANQPDLDSCPECGSPLTEMSGEQICHTCGLRQPIITQQMPVVGKISQWQALLPALLGVGAGEATAAGEGAAMMGGEAAASGMGGNVRAMGLLMNHAMQGQGQDAGAEAAQAATPTTYDPSIAMPGTIGRVKTADTQRLVKLINGQVERIIIYGDDKAIRDSYMDTGAVIGYLPDQDFDCVVLQNGSVKSGANEIGRLLDPEEEQRYTSHLKQSVPGTTWGDNAVGTATQNRGENSTADASSTGLAGMKEQGDSPEQLKDIDSGGRQSISPFSGDQTELQGGGWTLGDAASSAFQKQLPLVIEFALNPEKSGADNPLLHALDEMLEEAFPGYRKPESFNEEGADESPTEKMEEVIGQDLDDDSEQGEEHATRFENDRPQESKAVMAPISKTKEAAPNTVGFGYQQPGMNAVPYDSTGMGSTSPMPNTPCSVCGQIHQPGECPLAGDISANGAIMQPSQVVTKMADYEYQDEYRVHPDAEVVGHPDEDQGMYIEPDGTRIYWAGGRDSNSIVRTPDGRLIEVPWVDDEDMWYENRGGNREATPEEAEEIDRIRDEAFGDGEDDVNPKMAASVDEPDEQELVPMRHNEEHHDNRYEDGPTETGWYEDWKGPGEDEGSPWVDAQGEPLQPGQQYEMYSTQYSIPDRITVEHVSPDKLTYLIHSGQIDYRDELTPDDVANYGYSFKEPRPGQSDSESGFENEAERPNPPERTPLNLTDPRPHAAARTSTNWSDQQLQEAANWALQHGWSPEIRGDASAEPIPPQAELPIRPGQDALPQVDDISIPPTKQGGVTYTNPLGQEEHYLGSFSGDDPSARDWLRTGDSEGVDVDPGLMAKLAGKHFSPQEQRAFIDEEGVGGPARNLDKLSLEGTHYEEDPDTFDSLW